MYNNDVIIYKNKKNSWGQFCLWMGFPNFPITTLVKFLSSFIKRTTKKLPVTDIKGHIYNCIAGDIIVQIKMSEG